TVSDHLIQGGNAAFRRHGIPGRLEGLGARFGIYFGVDGPILNYRDSLRHDRQARLRFIASAIYHGVYFHAYGGAACHHGFCSSMTMADADECLRRLDQAIAEM